MPDFMIHAAIAGVLVAIITAPLGCFVVWRRMAYFGDTLSHSALLGVSLGLLFEMNITLAVVLTSVLLAMVLVRFQSSSRLSSDTLLGILAHSALSIGLVSVALVGDVRVDMMAYLFGDLLATNSADLWIIATTGAVVLSIIALLWKPLLAMSVHEELAQVEGVPVNRLRLVLTVIMALVIAIAMKIVGVMLITSLMIIPAATAQRMAKTPEQMALMAAGFGSISVGLGLTASWFVDTPAGPSVVVCSFVLFLISGLFKR